MVILVMVYYHKYHKYDNMVFFNPHDATPIKWSFNREHYDSPEDSDRQG